MKQVEPLLDLIKAKESRGDYNIVWGGIGTRHQPPRPLVQMTVGEVLAWQDSIDALYNSEASGAYQIMEDTLRGLVRQGVVSPNDMYNRKTQDRLAVALLERRGLKDFLAGRISTEKFANNVAKEWASFPVVTRLFNGKRMVNPGQSFYAGDGLNKALIKPAAVLKVLKEIKSPVPPNPYGWLHRIVMWLFETFTKYRRK